MRASKTEATATAGESEVQAEFERMGWATHRTSPGHDNGTDLLVSPRERRWESGIYVGVQVKSGPTSFRRPKRTTDGKVSGWWYIDEEGKELGGWARYPTPQIVVLRNLKSRTSYWEHVTPSAIRSTGKGDKIFIPAAQVLGPDSEDKLRAVAATFGNRGSLEGSWVQGFPIAPPDRLRYALIAPRLLAPHPNLGVDKLSPEQAIAMLAQVRAGELDRFAEEQSHVPRGKKALSSECWEWRFFGALWCRIDSGEANPLRQVLTECARYEQRAAVVACLASQMTGAARPEDALAALAPELAHDELATVDHGWLSAQRARALAELGEAEEARSEAEKLIALRQAAPEDQTAIAISASMAALYSNLSEPTVEVFRETLKATDTPTGWFRAQTVRSGLREVASRAFEEWMHDERTKWSREDLAHNRLLAAALEASHDADQVGWANLSGLLGRNALLELDRSAESDEIVSAISTLRLAGDVNALKLAVPHISDDGPCLAVTAALREVNPALATRTTGLAELTLIELGGDLADSETAERLGSWLLDAIADPARFVARTSPSYLFNVQLVSSLAGVIGSADSAIQRRALEQVIELDDLGDEALLERAWVRTLVGVSEQTWDNALAASAHEVAETRESGEFYRALMACAATAGDQGAREQLLGEVAEGRSEALWGLGPFSDLPENTVSALIACLSAKLREAVRASTQGGSIGLGFSDPAHDLSLLSIWHPEVADWDSLLDFLGAAEVPAQLKRGALRALAWGAKRLPEGPTCRLVQIAEGMVSEQGGEPAGLGFDRDADLSGLGSTLAAALGKLKEPDRWIADSLGGARRKRRLGATISAKLGRPGDIVGLATLTHDPDPYLRAIAASALSEEVARDQDSSSAHAAFDLALRDPGRSVPLAIARTLSDLDRQSAVADAGLTFLQEHASAGVRSAAIGGSQ